MSSGKGLDPLIFSLGRARLYTLLTYILWTKREDRKESSIGDAEKELLRYMAINPNYLYGFYQLKKEVPLARECPPPGMRREVYAKAIQDFYLNYGFESKELPPDHPASMLAFMAQLVSNETQVGHDVDKNLIEIWRMEHRFINTHLLNGLKCLRDKMPCKFTYKLLELVREDSSILFEKITEQSDS